MDSVKITKRFDATTVLEVVTGRCLQENGMSNLHELMDHFYPGIMTIGCAVMLPVAKEEIVRQHPVLAEIDAFNEDDFKMWLQHVLEVIPREFEITGPHDADMQDASRRYKEFFDGMDKKEV